MRYEFSIKGHQNLLATNKSTIEFTKDDFLTKRGNCIAGIEADFELEELKKFLHLEKASVIIKSEDIEEKISFIPNKDFASNHEMVIRIGEFASERTFGLRADKASSEISRSLIEKLKGGQKIPIIVIDQ